MNNRLLSLVFLIFTLVSLSVQAPETLPDAVQAELASREMRYHHFVFHNIRNLWNSLNATQQAAIKALGWKPPRPAKTAEGHGILDNDAGEDFLYMHNRMIAMVNGLLKKNNAPSLKGFVNIPLANDKNYPMPANFTAPTETITDLCNYYKSDEYLQHLLKEEKKLKDPAFLRTMTLGQLGAYIEWTSDVHQGMHLRFAEYSPLMRIRDPNPIPFIDPKWDVVTSDWLVDVYGSHVNPWFWKLHGWINDRIYDWAKAHGVSRIPFKGPWSGGNTDGLPKVLNIEPNADVRFLGNEEPEGRSLHDISTMEGDEDGMEIMKNMDLTKLEQIAKIFIEHKQELNHFADNEHDIEPTRRNWFKQKGWGGK